MLRLASRYNQHENTMKLSGQVTLTQDHLMVGGFGTLTDCIFRFAAALGQLDVDGAEFAMLCAICLMSGGTDIVC